MEEIYFPNKTTDRKRKKLCATQEQTKAPWNVYEWQI